MPGPRLVRAALIAACLCAAVAPAPTLSVPPSSLSEPASRYVWLATMDGYADAAPFGVATSDDQLVEALRGGKGAGAEVEAPGAVCLCRALGFAASMVLFTALLFAAVAVAKRAIGAAKSCAAAKAAPAGLDETAEADEAGLPGLPEADLDSLKPLSVPLL